MAAAAPAKRVTFTDPGVRCPTLAPSPRSAPSSFRVFSRGKMTKWAQDLFVSIRNTSLLVNPCLLTGAALLLPFSGRATFLQGRAGRPGPLLQPLAAPPRRPRRLPAASPGQGGRAQGHLERHLLQRRQAAPARPPPTLAPRATRAPTGARPPRPALLLTSSDGEGGGAGDGGGDGAGGAAAGDDGLPLRGPRLLATRDSPATTAGMTPTLGRLFPLHKVCGSCLACTGLPEGWHRSFTHLTSRQRRQNSF